MCVRLHGGHVASGNEGTMVYMAWVLPQRAKGIFLRLWGEAILAMLFGLRLPVDTSHG
jgi:hypothetical protein